MLTAANEDAVDEGGHGPQHDQRDQDEERVGMSDVAADTRVKARAPGVTVVLPIRRGAPPVFLATSMSACALATSSGLADVPKGLPEFASPPVLPGWPAGRAG